MRYYTSEMLIQIFIIAVILGWLLREPGQAGKEVWQIAVECMEIPKLQKSKKPAQSLPTQRVSKAPVYRG